jgi:hypothetical protein
MTRNYKQLYTLLRQQPGAENRSARVLGFDLVSQFSQGRTQDVKLLKDTEYKELIASLRQSSGKRQKMDRLRKRVIASIFGFFKLVGKEVTIAYVKAIAVRAAGRGCDNFNRISESKLRAIYNEFLRQQEVVRNIGREEAIRNMDASLLALCGIEVKVKKAKGAC